MNQSLQRIGLETLNSEVNEQCGNEHNAKGSMGTKKMHLCRTKETEHRDENIGMAMKEKGSFVFFRPLIFCEFSPSIFTSILRQYLPQRVLEAECRTSVAKL